MHDPATEAFASHEVWRVSDLVIEIAATHQQKVAAETDRLVGGFNVDGPTGVFGRPRRSHHPMFKADSAVDAELAGGLTYVLRIDAPSTMDFFPVQGRNGKP